MFFVSPDSIKQAVRQIQRWIFAAERDADTKIRLLHANYAVGNIDLLRQMTTDDKIINATGVNPLDLWRRATRAQDAASNEILRLLERR